MNQLQKTEKPLISIPPAIKLSKEDVFKVVQAEIARFYADTRFKIPSLPDGSPDEQEMGRMVNETCNDILNYAPQLRLSEIETAFRKGTRGMYGEYHGGSVATFNKFILGYLSSGEREQIIKKQRMPEKEEKPTKEQWDEKCTMRLKEAFEAVKKGQFWDDPGCYLYNWLDDKNLIPFSTDKKKQFMIEARQKLISEQQNNKAEEANPYKLSVISMYLREIQKGNHKDRVIVMAKKIALNTLIRDNIELGYEYKDFLNEK